MAESYLATVEAVYTSLRQSGFFLSPRDRSQVMDWERQGIPLQALLRLLADGVERYQQMHGAGQRPGSLRYFQGLVAEEAGRLRERWVGAPQERQEAVETRPLYEERLAAALSRLAGLSAEGRRDLGQQLKASVGQRPPQVTRAAHRDTLRSRLAKLLAG